MRVLVTGANGHLGFNLAKQLVDRGYEVRASVRSLADAEKTAPLRALGALELVEADVYKPEQLRAAMDGVEILFHLAAVYTMVPGRNGVDDVVRSNVEGAENALRAAADAGARKVVLTSSIYTLPLTRPGEPPVTEEQWAEALGVPYVRAKTLAEQRAWELARELGLDLVTILPGGICGPGFRRNTPSIDTIECVMRGYFRAGIPDTNFPYVDARDVAAAHVLAAEHDAGGRFTVANDRFPSFTELNEAMHRIDPAVPLPLMRMPPFMLAAAPFFDRLNHRLLGTPRVATREFMALLRGRIYNVSTARIQRELGWRQTIPFEVSLSDTMRTIAENRGRRAN